MSSEKDDRLVGTLLFQRQAASSKSVQLHWGCEFLAKKDRSRSDSVVNVMFVSSNVTGDS